MSRPRIAVVATIVSLSFVSQVAGCALVRPHERQNLARRSMTADRGKGESRADQHRAESREGAAGGTGEIGGGCGCN